MPERPFLLLTTYLDYKLFGDNFGSYRIQSLIWLIALSVLLYITINYVNKKIFELKDKKIGLLATLLIPIFSN